MYETIAGCQREKMHSVSGRCASNNANVLHQLCSDFFFSCYFRFFPIAVTYQQRPTKQREDKALERTRRLTQIDRDTYST